MAGLLRRLWEAIGEMKRAKRAHGQTLDDPAFGQLTYNRPGYWEGKVSLGPFGDDVPLHVDAKGGEPPTDAQRRAYQACVEDLVRLHRKVEQANYDFYNELILGDWRRQELEMRPEDEDLILREMPDVDDPPLLWRWLGDPGLHIPEQDEEGWTAQFGWGRCRWDEEHGWQIVIRNGEVVYSWCP